MADREEGQERTEQPTARRLEQAREQGQMVRSRELANLGLVLAGALGLAALGPGIFAGLVELTRRGLTAGGRVAAGAKPALAVALGEMVLDALVLLTPLLALLLAAALLGPLALGGWTFAASLLAFKLERLDPVKGLARVFSLNGLVELAKALAKFLVLAGAALLVLWTDTGAVLSLAREPLHAGTRSAGALLNHALIVLCGALALVAAVDVPYQVWQHRQRLRMSRQDLREELKETEGKPEVKSRIRSLQREIARRRMMEEVPRADVVVTNPSHYAVALRYRPDSMTAPQVVAKGADLLALRIREDAGRHGVPLVSAPPLARALYHGTRIGQEVPAGLYLAVAQVLAYVFALRRYRAEGGQPPAPPVELPVPEDLRWPR